MRTAEIEVPAGASNDHLAPLNGAPGSDRLNANRPPDAHVSLTAGVVGVPRVGSQVLSTAHDVVGAGASPALHADTTYSPA
jgi:hypothetical protein